MVNTQTLIRTCIFDPQNKTQGGVTGKHNTVVNFADNNEAIDIDRWLFTGTDRVGLCWETQVSPLFPQKNLKFNHISWYRLHCLLFGTVQFCPDLFPVNCFLHHVDLPLNTSWHSAFWLSSTLLSSPLDILTTSCWWDVDSFPQTCIIRALRRRKHTGAHRCWRTQKFPRCPSSSTLYRVLTQSNKMNKLQLLTRTNNESISAVYFQENWFTLNCGGTAELQGIYADSGGLWYTNQQQNKREGMYVLISKTTGAQLRLLNHNSAFLCWKRFYFPASHFAHSGSLLQSFLLLCTSPLRQKRMACNAYYQDR